MIMNEHVELTLPPDAAGWGLRDHHRPSRKMVESVPTGNCSDELRTAVMNAVRDNIRVKPVGFGSRFSAAVRVAVAAGYVPRSSPVAYTGDDDGSLAYWALVTAPVHAPHPVPYTPLSGTLPVPAWDSPVLVVYGGYSFFGMPRPSSECRSVTPDASLVVAPDVRVAPVPVAPYHVVNGVVVDGALPDAPAPSPEHLGGRAHGRPHVMHGWEWTAVMGGMVHTLSRPDMSYADFIRSHRADITDDCRPHGHLSDDDFRSLGVVPSESFDGVPECYTSLDDWDAYGVAPLLPEYLPDDWSDDGDVDVPDVDHGCGYRSGHWLFGDVVTSLAPAFTALVDGLRVVVPRPRRIIRMARDVFFSRTRIIGRRAGVITALQWTSLFGGGDVPDALRNAPSGWHRMDGIFSGKGSAARARVLTALGYDVRNCYHGSGVDGKKARWWIVIP